MGFCGVQEARFGTFSHAREIAGCVCCVENMQTIRLSFTLA